MPDAKFLVGIAIDADHRLLLANLLASRISSWKYGEFRVLQEGTELQSPAKLFCTESSVIVAPWGFTTDFSDNDLVEIFDWKPDSRAIRSWDTPMTGHWMGLRPNGAGGCLLPTFWRRASTLHRCRVCIL